MCGASAATASSIPPRSDRPLWVAPAATHNFFGIDDQLGTLELTPQASDVPCELQHLGAAGPGFGPGRFGASATRSEAPNCLASSRASRSRCALTQERSECACALRRSASPGALASRCRRTGGAVRWQTPPGPGAPSPMPSLHSPTGSLREGIGGGNPWIHSKNCSVMMSCACTTCTLNCPRQVFHINWHGGLGAQSHDRIIRQAFPKVHSSSHARRNCRITKFAEL